MIFNLWQLVLAMFMVSWITMGFAMYTISKCMPKIDKASYNLILMMCWVMPPMVLSTIVTSITNEENK